MKAQTNSFLVWDYLTFFATLVASMGVGVYFALKGRKQKTQGEYLMGGRNMSIIPVSISIVVSYLSAISILGNPAEMYTQGTTFGIIIFGMALAAILASVLFVPTIYPLRLTSIFEYLELRFNSRVVRLLGTWIMILNQVIYMGTSSFAPSTAFEAVTGFPAWATLVITAAVSTFYTCIGGMKAVIWTDVFQAFVMVAGVLAIIIHGAIDVGGMDKVWQINDDWGRIKFFDFDPDPTIRHAFWPLVVGSAITWMGTFGLNQPSVQRYSALPTLQKARLATLMTMFGTSTIMILCCLAGIVIFSYFAIKDCDPLGKGLVSNPNQLVPFFVMETMAYPCVPGLFVSALFSGALSSISSSLSALATITWEDMLKPHIPAKFSEAKKLLIIQSLVVVYGCLSLAVSFTVKNLEGTVLQITISLLGAVGGPLTGLFLLGGFFPWANAKGAVCGAVTALSLSCWLAISAFIQGIPRDKLDFPNGTCSDYLQDASNLTMTTTLMPTTTVMELNSTIVSSHSERTGLENFYRTSYLWYGTFGMAVTVVVGLLVSFCTGANSTHDVPTKYQIPLASRVLCCLPASWKKVLNCNREFQDPEVVAAEEKKKVEALYKIDQNNTKMDYDNPCFTEVDQKNGVKHENGKDSFTPVHNNNDGNDADDVKR